MANLNDFILDVLLKSKEKERTCVAWYHLQQEVWRGCSPSASRRAPAAPAPPVPSLFGSLFAVMGHRQTCLIKRSA